MLAFAINSTIDSDHMFRRIHVYWAAYTAIFYFVDFVLFLAWACRMGGRPIYIGVYLMYGFVFGCMAGAIAYTFGIVFDIFSVRPRVIPVATLSQGGGSTAFAVVTYPIMVLRSWLYGSITGLLFYFGEKLSRRRYEHWQ